MTFAFSPRAIRRPRLSPAGGDVGVAAAVGAAPLRAPQHFLYFRPLPHGHGALRSTLEERNCSAA